MTNDPFNLSRFVDAQRGAYDHALTELHAGRKRTHWMWFIFPQLRGFGRSSTAQLYGIAGLPEARAYLAHPTLGQRLRACTHAAATIQHRSLTEIFGTPDDLKFRSCMTLFEAAQPADPGFAAALQTLCGNQRDTVTLRLLAPPG